MEWNGPSPILMLCNIRSTGYKTITMQSYFPHQQVDPECVTETWIRKGEAVTLKDFPHTQVSWSFINLGHMGNGGVAILKRMFFFFLSGQRSPLLFVWLWGEKLRRVWLPGWSTDCMLHQQTVCQACWRWFQAGPWSS